MDSTVSPGRMLGGRCSNLPKETPATAFVELQVLGGGISLNKISLEHVFCFQLYFFLIHKTVFTFM